jgi:hypothetical protein
MREGTRGLKTTPQKVLSQRVDVRIAAIIWVNGRRVSLYEGKRKPEGEDLCGWQPKDLEFASPPQ